MISKICTKCGEEKNVNEFNKDKNTKDGLHFWCKECMKKRNKQWREENKEYKKEYGKRYRKDNKEKMKEYYKEYYKENKEEKLEYQKQRYEKNKEKMKEQHKQWYKEKVRYDTFAERISFCEEARRDPEVPKFLQVRCTYCNKWFNPTNREVQHRIASLNDKGSGESRLYCSEECKELCSLYNQREYPKGFRNTENDRPHQKEWTDMVKERDDYICQKCGKYCGDDCIVHHFEGINVNPIMFHDIEMGITLCTECHKESHKDVGCRPTDLTKESLCN